MNDEHEEKKLPCSECDRCFFLLMLLTILGLKVLKLLFPQKTYVSKVIFSYFWTMMMLVISAVAGSFGQTSNELPMQRVTLTKRYSLLESIKETKNVSFLRWDLCSPVPLVITLVTNQQD